MRPSRVRSNSAPHCSSSRTRSGDSWAWSCAIRQWRSEEHTSELQSHVNLVCRLLLEKKKYSALSALGTHLALTSSGGAIGKLCIDKVGCTVSIFSPQYLSSISSFFFNDAPTTEIYTLSLHDALPI